VSQGPYREAADVALDPVVEADVVEVDEDVGPFVLRVAATAALPKLEVPMAVQAFAAAVSVGILLVLGLLAFVR
jgi:hypothetical protein